MATPPEAAPSDEKKKSPSDMAAFWLGEIERADRSVQRWHKQGDKIVKRYRDDRGTNEANTAHKMNVLWSNVETLKPALYAQSPKPNVTRRWKDKNPVGRIAATVLERALEYTLQQYDFDSRMRQVVGDYLLPGRGQLWVKFNADVEGDAVSNERVVCDYVHWKDFLTNPARTPDEIWWMARRDYMTREELTKRFPQGNKVTLDAKGPDVPDTDKSDQFKRATVWTIWSKRHNAVFYVAPGYKDGPLEEQSPPSLSFDDFFPCPRPATATTASDSTIPTPDFVLYQDQADEIDKLTQRINVLSDALKVRGLYNGELGPSIARLLSDSDNNELIPVDNWAMFAQGQGFKGNIDFLPVREVAETLKFCMEAREAAKQALYEVTGIGDIVRGASNPNETATAQQIKSQWGSVRIRDRQHEVQRFARDVIKLKAEIIAEHFSPETLAQISGVKLPTPQEKQQAQMALQAQQQPQQPPQPGMPPAPPPPPPPPGAEQIAASPTWDDVIGLLRNEKLRGFVISIETDSTVEADQEAEKQGAIEFVQSVTGFLSEASKILPAAPMLAPMMGELLLFAVRRFKQGDQLEEPIETAMEELSQALSQPKPDPEAEQAKAELELKKATAQQDGQIKMQQAQLDGQIKMQSAQLDGQIKQQQAQADLALGQQKAQQDAQIAQFNAVQKARQAPPGGER